MSAIAKPSDWISPDEYIEGELRSEVRHEYVDGNVYGMAGASIDQNRIAGNIFGELRSSLRGRGCEAFIHDVKVKIRLEDAEVFYYPDVIVVCDPTEKAKYHRERPSIIFEVLSPDTERIDRGEKAVAYRQIPNIALYVLVEQARMAITCLMPDARGWQSQTVEGENAILRLDRIGVEIPLQVIYESAEAAARAAR